MTPIKILILLLLSSSVLSAQTFDSFTDERDGQIYRTVSWRVSIIADSIEKITWMAENLKFNHSESSCYNDDTANCETFGRLYNFTAAMESCPAGWTLPTNDQWEQLIDQFGGLNKAGKKLKSRSKLWQGSKPELEGPYFGASRYSGNDKSGFSILPTGVGTSNTGYYNFGISAVFWSASLKSKTAAWDWIFSASTSAVVHSDGNMITTGNSVRCIKINE